METSMRQGQGTKDPIMRDLTGYGREHGMILSENRNSVFVNIIFASLWDQEQVLFIATFSASSTRNVP